VAFAGTGPPISTALRCSAMNLPLVRSRTSASLIGVPVKSNSSRSLASGSFAIVSWYLIERVCFSALKRSPTMRGVSLDAARHNLVISGTHAEQLERRHQLKDIGALHQEARRRLS
jgi:hypothetical protein